MRLNFDEIVETVAAKPKPLLVAVDGLPLAGKSTLAERLVRELGAECLWLDDFMKPEVEWPSRNTPSFPFDYVLCGWLPRCKARFDVLAAGSGAVLCPAC